MGVEGLTITGFFTGLPEFQGEFDVNLRDERRLAWSGPQFAWIEMGRGTVTLDSGAAVVG
jgi:hypothetical protein